MFLIGGNLFLVVKKWLSCVEAKMTFAKDWEFILHNIIVYTYSLLIEKKLGDKVHPTFWCVGNLLSLRISFLL